MSNKDDGVGNNTKTKKKKKKKKRKKNKNHLLLLELNAIFQEGNVRCIFNRLALDD